MSIKTNIFGNITSNQEIMPTPKFGYGLFTNSNPSNSIEKDKVQINSDGDIFSLNESKPKEFESKTDYEPKYYNKSISPINENPLNLAFVLNNPPNISIIDPVNKINNNNITVNNDEEKEKEPKIIITSSDKDADKVPIEKKENFIEIESDYASNENSSIKENTTSNLTVRIYYDNYDVEVLKPIEEDNESYKDNSNNKNYDSIKIKEEDEEKIQIKSYNNDSFNSSFINKHENNAIELPKFNQNLLYENNSQYPNDYDSLDQNEYYNNINEKMPRERIKRRKIYSEVPFIQENIMNSILAEKYNYEKNMKITFEKEESNFKLMFYDKYLSPNNNNDISENNESFYNFIRDESAL